MDKRVDSAVEEYGKACFGKCAQPLNATSACYLDCYKNALLGDPAYNLTAMPVEAIVDPWKGGFGAGGCAEVKPKHCEARDDAPSQCGPQ